MLDPQATAHARDWIDVLQALLTPTIAVLALTIGFAQWWVARNKFRLDLFDRRWAVYVSARDIIGLMFTQGSTSREQQHMFLQGTRGAKWLFNSQVDDYLKKTMWGKLCALDAVNSMLEPSATPAERSHAAAEKIEIMRWVIAQDTGLDLIFADFMQMDAPFGKWIKRRWGKHK